MACDFSCNLHDSLHEHIATAHAHAGRLVRCSKCGRHEGYVRYENVCRFCGIFSAQLNEHLVAHYRDRVGPGALMECQRCPKTFTTVEAVREHERRLHGAPSALSTPSQQSHGCGLCENRFPTRQSRDIHLVMNHHQQFVNKCWGEVERQLAKEASPTNTYQCILCRRSILGRKTYRLHFIHRHIVAEVAVMSGGAKNEPVDHDIDEPDSVTKIRNVVLAAAQQIVTGCGGKEKLRAQSPVSSQNEAPISVADYDVPMMLDPDV